MPSLPFHDISHSLILHRIGTTLQDALDEMIEKYGFPPQQALKVVSHFDRHMAEALREKVTSKLSIKVCTVLPMRGMSRGGRGERSDPIRAETSFHYR
jgi:hexokinase